MYYIYVDNGKLDGCGEAQCLDDNVINAQVSEEVYNDYAANRDKYIYSNGEIVINPDYAEIEANKRREQFYNDFFNTSLGFIRRKVSMKTGEIKDFLTDLLPVISMAVNSGQQVNIIAYKEPDSWLQDITDWEELQEIKVATPQFIQECFNQVSKDFSGVE